MGSDSAVYISLFVIRLGCLSKPRSYIIVIFTIANMNMDAKLPMVNDYPNPQEQWNPCV
jgi:hypothetical protein